MLRCVLLLLYHQTVITQQALIPKELVIEKDPSIKYAVASDQEVTTFIEFKMDFSHVASHLTPILTNVLADLCTGLNRVAEYHHTRSRRDVSDFLTSENVLAVVVGAVGSALPPLGAGIGAGLSVRNTALIKGILEENRNKDDKEVVKQFARDMDQFLYFNHISDAFLHGISEHFMRTANLSSIYEVRDRVRVHAQECRGNSIIATARYPDPHSLIHGNIYLVADPGEFVRDKTSYVHYALPETVFLKDDMTEVNVRDCKLQFGGGMTCKKVEAVPVDQCAIYNYREHCPRIVAPVMAGKAIVRPLGHFFIIVSTDLFKLRVADETGKVKVIELSLGGISKVKLSRGESFKLQGVDYHGYGHDTLVVTIDMASRSHYLPYGIEYHIPTEIPSNSEVYNKLFMTFAFSIVGGFIVLLGIIFGVRAIANANYSCQRTVPVQQQQHIVCRNE